MFGHIRFESLQLPHSPDIDTYVKDRQPSLVRALQQKSVLVFATVLTKDCYAHAYSYLSTEQQKLTAKKLIAQFGYGAIKTTGSGNQVLFFSHINSTEHCKEFRDAVARLD